MGALLKTCEVILYYSLSLEPHDHFSAYLNAARIIPGAKPCPIYFSLDARLAIAITANFVNKWTPEEQAVEEIGGLSRYL